ncbi:receptor-type adenylate cyclase, putative, partial [Trypanosoma cruzi marinkellei]
MYITTHTVDCAGLSPHVFGGAFVADAHVFSAAVAETTDSSPFLCAPFSSLLRFSCRKPQATQQEILKAASMAVGWVAVWPREQRACAAARCLIVALLLLLDLPCVVAQSSGDDRVVKVVSFEFDIPLLDAFSRNIKAGFNASLHSRNNSIMNGVRVEIVGKRTKLGNYASDLSAALNNDSSIYAVVGHCGDKLLLNIKDV